MTSDAKVDVWMPLYIADYLSSTSRLTTVQHGAYMLLIMDYWKNGKLPDDDSILAQIVKMNPDAWSIARAVLAQFFSIENGEWTHSRIESEMIKAGSNRMSAKAKAVKAAEARWGKNKNASSNAPSISQAMPEQCPSPSPSPSPLTSKKIKSKTKDQSGKINALAIIVDDGVNEKIAADWLALRKQKRSPVTETALDGIKTEAARAGYSLETALRVCCERGWAGFNADWVLTGGSAKKTPAPDNFESINYGKGVQDL